MDILKRLGSYSITFFLFRENTSLDDGVVQVELPYNTEKIVIESLLDRIKNIDKRAKYNKDINMITFTPTPEITQDLLPNTPKPATFSKTSFSYSHLIYDSYLDAFTVEAKTKSKAKQIIKLFNKGIKNIIIPEF